jgi:regulator of sirC expression with transglutaminase-like and TPR domain
MTVAARLAALAALASACARPAPRPPGPVASAIVALAAELGAAPPDVARAWAGVEGIAARVDARRRRTGGDPVDAMNAVVFDELGFAREIDSDDVPFFRLPSVIADRRGSCLGLGALYLVLGERLGVPIDGVMVPGHFFVRAPAGGARAAPRNVELLRRGEAMPDAWYRGKYGPWPADGAEYFRPLAPSELAAVHWFNVGNHLRAARDLPGAERAYARAAALFPELAEAHAGLGAVRQLEGALDGAAAAYGDAARARADLPGLDHNVTLLKEEQRRRQSP